MRSVKLLVDINKINTTTKCGCMLERFPKKYQLPVEFENGEKGFITLNQEQIEKIKEKAEIMEVFE